MFGNLSKYSSIKNILVFSLTNIGDVLMICPVIDVLRRDFPSAKMTVVVGPKAVSVFEGHQDIEVVIFEKHAPWGGQIKWFLNLFQCRFDLVVDLRNTILPFLLMPKYCTPLGFGGKFNGHLVQKHLTRLGKVYPFNKAIAPRSAIQINASDKRYVDELFKGYLSMGDRFVVVAPVAADLAKTWGPQGFVVVCEALMKAHGLKVVLLGSNFDQAVMKEICSGLSKPALDLSGKTNLVQVAELCSRAAFVIVHDSGIMHIASYMGIPVVALFGKTDPDESAPWSERWQVVRRNKKCARCLDPRSNVPHNCMSFIQPEDVLKAVKELGF